MTARAAPTDVRAGDARLDTNWCLRPVKHSALGLPLRCIPPSGRGACAPVALGLADFRARPDMSISIAYWCVLIAAVLPYVWVGVAKSSARGYDNRDPRGWLARQSSPRLQRAHAAHLNAFEAFPAFAAGVVVAHLAGVPEPRVALLAVVFVVARIAHGLLYLADRAVLRSLAWLVGLGCALALIAQAALHAA